ncbi:MAG: ComF family protein [Dehalococcoidales bacterium]|nr:ComF family protein [Dehalococcoidales bacterium]
MALDLLFPKFCVGCGKEGDFICSSCQASLPCIEPPVCTKCGKPQINFQASPGVNPATVLRMNEVFCSSCIGWEADIDGIRSPFRFEGVIRKAIHAFKYNNLRAITGRLAKLLSDYLIANPIRCDVLTPVPLHDKRLRERGYNQSCLLAKELGRLTGIPVSDSCLVRHHYNLPQARTANVEERRQNVVGVFACQNDDLRGKKVLLIDDVTTSGATLNACASVLKTAEAMSVWGLTLAREI